MIIVALLVRFVNLAHFFSEKAQDLHAQTNAVVRGATSTYQLLTRIVNACHAVP